MLAIDIARAFDSLTKQGLAEALKAWGVTEGPFLTFLLSSQNYTYFVEGLRGMSDSEVFDQREGEGTGAPECRT